MTADGVAPSAVSADVTYESLRGVRKDVLRVARARMHGAWARRWLAVSSSTRQRLVVCACVATAALFGVATRMTCFVALHGLVLGVTCNRLMWIHDTRQVLRLAEDRHALWRSTSR